MTRPVAQRPPQASLPSKNSTSPDHADPFGVASTDFQPAKPANVAISEGSVAGLPKAELHVHHTDSVSQRIVAELANRHPGKVPGDPDELARFFVFDDFAHFIRNYLLVIDLIKTAEDIHLITYEVAADMAEQNSRYAELTVMSYISISDDLPAEAFLEAIEDARQGASRDLGLEPRWIFDIPADFGLPAAELTASVALDHDVPGLVGFGLGGAERGFPRSIRGKPPGDRVAATTRSLQGASPHGCR
jgi:aminodeoxyfutalosine deaminase